MPVPILKMGETLVASIQAALSDTDWDQFRRALLSRAGDPKISGAIVDLTVMDVVDSFAARTLRDLVQMVRLRGAEVVIVGIQPDVAFAMAQLGLRLEGVATALDLDGGIELLGAKRTAGRPDA
jgi:rsbT antagonist protein RsbS